MKDAEGLLLINLLDGAARRMAEPGSVSMLAFFQGSEMRFVISPVCRKNRC